jgi:hypothetical protein
MCLPDSVLGHPAPVRHVSHLPAPRRHSQVASSRLSDRAILLISVYGLGEGEGDGEAAGDAVGEGDREVVGDAVGGSVVAGPVEELGVRMVAVPSGRADGSYGPLRTADNAAAPTTAASKHAGASTTTSGTRTNGGTNPSKTYHNNAPNTTTTGTDSHHGNPRISRPLPSYTLPPSYPVREERF